MTKSQSAQPPGIVEEHFLDVGTGVEAEPAGDASPDEIASPWKPEQIRVNTKPFSLRNVLDMRDEGGIDFAPDFQRGTVWKQAQKSRLIESVLLQIPLPAFYFAEDAEGKMRVVDGLQRLSTIYDFVRGGERAGFALKGLEYLGDQVGGKRFEELPAPWQRRIHNAQISAHVIDPSTPSDVMYEIFKRINTGGTPLNAQEIRHCMSRDRSREILKRLTGLAEFDKATNGMSGHVRMNDREMALRFAAFWLLGVDEYSVRPSMDHFLERVTEMLDHPGLVPDTRVTEMTEAFRTAMLNAVAVFGAHAFRKWPEGVDGRNPINRALFETWSIALSGHAAEDLEARRVAIVQAARMRMTNDHDYLDAITSSTGDRRRVMYRFAAAEQDAEARR